MVLPDQMTMFVLFGLAAVPAAYQVGSLPPGWHRGVWAFMLFVLGVLLFVYLNMVML